MLEGMGKVFTGVSREGWLFKPQRIMQFYSLFQQRRWFNFPQHIPTSDFKLLKGGLNHQGLNLAKEIVCEVSKRR